MKPAKKTQPAVEEKFKRPEPKAPKQTYDMPAVQCKDTLLLDYDYSKQYSKRSVVNNWDKYADLPDDDPENGQLTAADFEQLLSASKSIGDHFTFAAERSWLQNDGGSQSDENSIAADLFKLNISNLKNGIGRLPFYVRQGLSEDMFTSDEITNMNYKVKYFGDVHSQKPTAANQMNQNLLNILTKDPNEKSSAGDNKATNDSLKTLVYNNPTRKVDVKPLTQHKPAQTLEDDELIDQLTEITLAPTTVAAHTSKPIEPLPTTTSTAKSNKTEDIQDWLDDILNEN